MKLAWTASGALLLLLGLSAFATAEQQQHERSSANTAATSASLAMPAPVDSSKPEEPERRPKRPHKFGRPAKAEEQPAEEEELGEEPLDEHFGEPHEAMFGAFRAMQSWPMQLGRLMSAQMDMMREPARFMDAMRSRGALASSASVFSDADGLTRSASSVTNNGRTRGIISETRNGRTRTRTFGQAEESEEREPKTRRSQDEEDY